MREHVRGENESFKEQLRQERDEKERAQEEKSKLERLLQQENDVSSAMMRSVDIEFSDDMESGRNGWTDYKSLSNPWHLIDTDTDENREAASPTHAMYVGDESKGDGEYENNWDFSLYTAQNISLGQNPAMSVNLWYSVENSWDGGNVQISTDGGESWTVIEPEEIGRAHA